MIWQFVEAKNKLSKIVNLALSEGPQCIERRDDKMILLAKKTYDQLMGEKTDFKTFLLSIPRELQELDLDRDQSLSRNIC